MNIFHEDGKSRMEEEDEGEKEEGSSRERPKRYRARDLAAKTRTTPDVPAILNFKPALPSSL